MSAFLKILEEERHAPPYNGSLRAFARAIGIDHSHLAKALDGSRAFSPTVVGQVARLLPKERAQELIKAYLQETAAEIAEAEGRKPVLVK